MERRRTPLPIVIFFIMMFLIAFANAFDISPLVTLVILVPLVAVLLILIIRPRARRQKGVPPEFEGIPFKPPIRPRVGRWIIIPIAIGSLVGFILFQNWWLTVKIFQSMYSTKAGIDWWNINFLNNYYFYACIAIGLLIALSDPRIAITKDETGKRRLYFHSKFWGVVNAVFTQIYQYGGEFPVRMRMGEAAWDDKIPLKRGILWKLLEFLVGTLAIGPLMAQDLALRYLLIAKWIETQQISWINFLQRCFSTLSTIFFTSEYASGTILGKPLGTWLIENSPILEFFVWIRALLMIFGTIWIIRLVVSFIFELRRGNIGRSLRSITTIGLILLTPILLQLPTQVFDITTPFYVRTMVIAEIILIILTIFFSLKGIWVKRAIGILYGRKIILAALIILVVGSLSLGPVVVAFQYSPAMQGNWKKWVWEPKYLPTVEYTRWATGLEPIKEAQVTAAMDTGENLAILSQIRVFNDAAAQLKQRPSIGVNWMDFGTSPDIIFSGGKEYWVSPLTIALPPIGGSEDEWRAMRMLITHSERILAINAANGEIVPVEKMFNITSSVSVSMYYGEGGLFDSSNMVYIGIPGFPENHLPEYVGPASYIGEPDYVLTGYERLWFFSGIYGQEMMRWDFGRGDYGDIKMLYLRDISKRLSSVLYPGMIIDKDPYLVSDGKNIYYSLYVYIDRPMPTDYLDVIGHEDKFWRVFANVLINTYDGSIEGYLLNLDEDNYIMDFYHSLYPQWNQPVPKWLESQLRYPEFLFERQIDSYNWYHVSDPDPWQQSTDFFELTRGTGRSVIEDTRYVSFSLNKTTYWTAVRLVEWYQSPGKNLAGLYVALNGKDLGDLFLIRSEAVAVVGPQTALDTITNYGATKQLLTLNPNWVSGNILLYVIRGTPYYFVPFYARTETTLSPTMIVAVNALSQKVGYYVIADPTAATEVGSASAKAYSNLGLKIESSAEDRREKILNEFNQLGYSTRTPQQLNPNIAFREDSSSFYKDEDWNNTRSLISAFVNTWAAPNNVNTILQWETTEGSVSSLNLGVLISQNGVVELHYITISYSSG